MSKIDELGKGKLVNQFTYHMQDEIANQFTCHELKGILHSI